jgi:hypothetical protein
VPALDPPEPGGELLDPLREVGDVALLAVVRVVLEFLGIVEQRLDEADGRLSSLLIKLIKLIAGKTPPAPSAAGNHARRG